jgi:Arc/MetJ family transcription regulator
MRTTVDIDEGVLRAAEAQARHQGKPLAALVEEALRVTLHTSASDRPTATPPEADEGLEDNDPFFAALDEIRDAGRQPASVREVHLE